MFLYVCKLPFHISPVRISQKANCNAKPLAYYFYAKTKILVDLHICISVPLNEDWIKICWTISCSSTLNRTCIETTQFNSICRFYMAEIFTNKLLFNKINIKLINNIPKIPFYTPWKRQTKYFLALSRGIKIELFQDIRKSRSTILEIILRNSPLFKKIAIVFANNLYFLFNLSYISLEITNGQRYFAEIYFCRTVSDAEVFKKEI